MSRARLKLSTCLVALCAVGAACGGGGGDGAAPTTVPPYDASEGVASPAAELRTDLTALLSEHALLTGITSAAVIAGEDRQPAAAELDLNSVALAQVVTTLYGAPAGPQFLDLWRRRIAALLEFAAASGIGDKARTDAAKASITAAESEIATVLNTANVQLTVENLTDGMEAFSRPLQTAITAQAKKDGTGFVKLKAASDDAAAAAIVLAAGIVKLTPDDFPGSLDGTGSALRAELTSKLQEHAYLAGLATGTVVVGGDLDPPAEALEENSLELARAFGTVYGDDVQRGFLDLWRDHISFFVDFAEAARTGNAVGMETARRELDGYRAAFADLLHSANPNLAAEDVSEALRVHVDSQLAVVSAQAAKDPGQVAKLREAAGHMPDTALYLVTGIARQFPVKFG